MSFTDQKQRVATEADCKAAWNGVPNGKEFRCYMCGHKFVPGDKWRWVCSKKYINFTVCGPCDAPDIQDRWIKHVEEGLKRFWWMNR